MKGGIIGEKHFRLRTGSHDLLHPREGNTRKKGEDARTGRGWKLDEQGKNFHKNWGIGGSH